MCKPIKKLFGTPSLIYKLATTSHNKLTWQSSLLLKDWKLDPKFCNLQGTQAYHSCQKHWYSACYSLSSNRQVKCNNNSISSGFLKVKRGHVQPTCLNLAENPCSYNCLKIPAGWEDLESHWNVYLKKYQARGESPFELLRLVNIKNDKNYLRLYFILHLALQEMTN